MNRLVTPDIPIGLCGKASRASRAGHTHAGTSTENLSG
jgi:hypothetical protein